MVPAAAAVELLHEFSLVHDDIEDGDRERRGRPTLWAVWGLAQAINAGDALFALAFRALNGLAERDVPPGLILEAQRRFVRTVMRLCEGQHLDLAFEQRVDITPDDYVLMVGGKTAALVALAAELGGLVAGAEEKLVSALARFGRAVGLAFQMQDDLLGLWGNPERTGKPAGNDLRRRKKSLPILLARHMSDEVAALLDMLYTAEHVSDGMVLQALRLIERSGARQEVEARTRDAYREAVQVLDELEAELTPRRLVPLRQLTEELMGREY
ncbi:MAG: polyprenyl synthetase family protein [Ardenticatenia bacterium]|nr:polyprenyl synthetase family protein [Ardenticatenia bacterium]